MAAYDAQRCDGLTSDKSQLAGLRTSLTNPADHIILPETMSKEPLGPVWAHGDQQWGDVVRWVVNALIIAEEKGVTQANVLDIAASDPQDPEIRRVLGIEGEFGALLGLEPDLIRLSPFTPAATCPPPIRAAELGIRINPRGILYSLPMVGSFVGGDVTAGILASGMHASDELSLLIDLSTNGEEG